MRLVLALCCAAHAFVGPHRSAPPRLQATAQEISAKTEGTETIFSLEEVQKILPHRYPFALVDKVIEYEAGKSAVGVKCVTFNEPQFTGHFPDRPIMPGVMQIEALAQLAGVVCLQMEGAEPGAVFFFAGVDGVVTADIDDEEERSACRDARKALNRDVERVRERIQGLHVELNKVS